jgi:predicted acyltransferase (DUF342 family)
MFNLFKRTNRINSVIIGDNNVVSNSRIVMSTDNSTGNKICINGRTIDLPEGNKVEIKNGNVYVDGVKVDLKKETGKDYSLNLTMVIIQGDVNNVEANCDLEINGNVTGKIRVGRDMEVSKNVYGEGTVEVGRDMIVEGRMSSNKNIVGRDIVNR